MKTKEGDPLLLPLFQGGDLLFVYVSLLAFERTQTKYQNGAATRSRCATRHSTIALTTWNVARRERLSNRAAYVPLHLVDRIRD